MCVAGGKRCKYSDALANVRKKTRNKMAGSPYYEVEPAIVDAVRAFQESNPDLVKEHLPEVMGFQCSAPAWDIPASLREKMGNKKELVAGVGEAGKKEFYSSLYERKQAWVESLDKDEDNALHAYAMDAYEPINLHLRRRGFQAWLKAHPYLYDRPDEDAGTYLRDVVKHRIAGLDSAMEKTVAPADPEKLYRFFRVPNGVTPQEYIKKYMTPGTGFKDRGFLSASADPEYVAAHIMNRSDGKRNKGYVVLEMLSSAGGSLQPSDHPNSGHVQSLEAEVLLPRNTGMRIMETASRRFEFSKDRPDLEQRFRSWGGKAIDFSEGGGLSLPVVRMIDESLIRNERKLIVGQQ